TKGLAVLRDIDDRSVRITDEEASEPPLLIRERIDNLSSSRDGASMDLVHIIHLDGDVWVDPCVHVELHHAELHFSLLRPEEQDPFESVCLAETEDAGVERPALVEALRKDVRLDPLDRHSSQHIASVDVARCTSSQYERPAGSRCRSSPGVRRVAAGFVLLQVDAVGRAGLEPATDGL